MNGKTGEEPRRKIKIAHGLEDLEEELILTLKDQPILNDGKINDEADILQNDTVQELSEAHHNAELRSKIKKLADVSSSHLEAKNEGINNMLPHYDDHGYQAPEIELQEGEFIKKVKSNKHKTIPEDFEGKSNSNCSFKQIKPKSYNNTSSILEFLNDTPQEEEQESNYPKRNAANIIEDSLQNVKKRKLLESCIKQTIDTEMNKKCSLENEEESLLLQSLNARRKMNEAERREKSVLEMVKEEAEDEERINDNRVEIELNPISFNSKSQNIKKEYSLNDVTKGTSSVMLINLPSECRENATILHHEEQQEKKLTKEELEAMKEEIKFMQEKELGTGLSGALQYLRSSALLGKEEYAGRSTDKEFEYNGTDDRIKLEYRNSSGKIMKPKEAYRYLCATFHGEGPSKNKIEKRKKKELEELRMKESANRNGKMLEMLEQHQHKNQQAHLVLQFGK